MTMTVGCNILCWTTAPNRCVDAFPSRKLLRTTHHKHFCKSDYGCFLQTITQSRKPYGANILPWIPSTKIFLSNSPMDLNNLNEQHHTAINVLYSSFNEIKLNNAISTINLSLYSSPSPLESDIVVPIIVFVALIIGILANGWISRLLSGEQGLGSYLSDGSGYNKSKFKPLQPRINGDKGTTKNNNDRAVQGDDPLPWLRLPDLDFVEVAGQNNPSKQRISRRAKSVTSIPVNDTTTENSLLIGKRDMETSTSNSIALEELELLRLRMQEQLLIGNMAQAEQLRSTLESIMKENNIQFTKETE